MIKPTTYQPEIWRVEKNTIYAAILAIESGLEYAREYQPQNQASLNNAMIKNRPWAETLEKDTCHMERTLEMLRACGPNSADDIVLELKLPVPVKELAAITDALCKIHGENTLYMRQVGPMLQLYKPRAASPPNDQAHL